MRKGKYDFIELYFRDLNEEPFRNSEEQWKAWEEFIDMLSMIALVNKEEENGDCLDKIGSLLNDVELIRAIEPHEKISFEKWKEVRTIFFTLLRKGDMTEDAEVPLPLWQFLNTGILEPVEIAALIFSAAMDLNRKYERVYGVLMEETNGVHKPTFGFVHDMCRYFLTEEERNPVILMNSDSDFRRFIMMPVDQRPIASAMSTPVMINDRVIRHIKGDTNTGLGKLSGCAAELEGFEEIPEYVIAKELLDEALMMYSAVMGTKEQGVLFFEAEKGAGLSFLMRCVSTVTCMTVLQVDFRKLVVLPLEQIDELLLHIVWKCLYEQEILFLDHFEWNTGTSKETAYIVSRLQRDLLFMVIGGEKNALSELPVKGQLVHKKLRRPAPRAQRRLWAIFSEQLSIRYTEDFLDILVSKYNLTPGEIHSALVNARMYADYDMEGNIFILSREEIEREIRQNSAPRFGDNVVKLESQFTLDDLQLEEDSRKLLTDAMNRIIYRTKVLDDYGFARKLPYGSGVSIVLYGPPGTGKTMSAQALANELRLDLYRIDLSQISSKYIGETEKNLANIFKTAEGSNAILFFDEADVLFSKRTEVSSSNDKHANAEVAYLLQRIESYTGISILATNGVQNFDAAFKRRMTYMIPIQMLDENGRLQLWKKIFPEETPVDKTVDFELFAKKAELSGSSIKSAALSAAYKAAAENRAVCDIDIATAINDEYIKLGHLPVFNQMMLDSGNLM